MVKLPTQLRLALLQWVAGNEPALTALSMQNISNLADCIHEGASQLGITLPACTNDQLFQSFASWIQSDKKVPQELHSTLHARKKASHIKRHIKRKFIAHAELNLKPAERDALLDTIPVVAATALQTPYPPFKEIVAESKAIQTNWTHYFAKGYQADGHKDRLSIHDLDTSKLAHNIKEDESAIIKNDCGEIVGIVIHNFCQSNDALLWAADVAARQIPNCRNIQVWLISLFNLCWSPDYFSNRWRTLASLCS